MFISATFRILSFHSLPFIPQKKSASNFPQITPWQLSAFRAPHSTKYPFPSFMYTSLLTSQPGLGSPRVGVSASCPVSICGDLRWHTVFRQTDGAFMIAAITEQLLNAWRLQTVIITRWTKKKITHCNQNCTLTNLKNFYELFSRSISIQNFFDNFSNYSNNVGLA